MRERERCGGEEGKGVEGTGAWCGKKKTGEAEVKESEKVCASEGARVMRGERK